MTTTSGSWTLTAATPLGRTLTVHWDGKHLTPTSPETPEGFLIDRRINQTHRPVKATHTGPYAPPAVTDTEDWVIYQTVYEAIAEWVPRHDIHVTGRPHVPDLTHQGAVQ